MIDFENFFDGSKEAKIFNKITENIIKKESKKLIDNNRIERDKTWNALCDQVVGSEI